MRDTSAIFRQASFAQQTGEVYALLVTIEHPDLTAPIRLSTDNADTFVVEGTTVRGTTSNSNNYLYLPMAITWPDDSEETVQQASIDMCNIDPVLMQTVRALGDPRPTIEIQVVLASTPDVIEARTGQLELVGFSADMMVVSATLGRKNFYGAPFPGGVMAMSNFPGVF